MIQYSNALGIACVTRTSGCWPPYSFLLACLHTCRHFMPSCPFSFTCFHSLPILGDRLVTSHLFLVRLSLTHAWLMYYTYPTDLDTLIFDSTYPLPSNLDTPPFILTLHPYDSHSAWILFPFPIGSRPTYRCSFPNLNLLSIQTFTSPLKNSSFLSL